jgi:hypothetical protein
MQINKSQRDLSYIGKPASSCSPPQSRRCRRGDAARNFPRRLHSWTAAANADRVRESLAMVVCDEKEPLLLEGAGQKVYSALVADPKDVSRVFFLDFITF